MSQYYYKNKLEGKEHFSYSCNEPQDNENFIEITEEEYKDLVKAYEENIRINSQLAFDDIKEETGFIKHSDINKVYIWTSHDQVKFDINTDITIFKIDLFIKELEKGTVFPPVKGYYNSVMDRYILFDGFHRTAAFNHKQKDIPYLDTMFTANIETCHGWIEGYRDQKELIEMGELDSTTLTDDQYKELLKMVNNWREKASE